MMILIKIKPTKFFRGNFAGPRFSLVDNSCIRNFFSWVFYGCKIFLMDNSWATREHVSEE